MEARSRRRGEHGLGLRGRLNANDGHNGSDIGNLRLCRVNLMRIGTEIVWALAGALEMLAVTLRGMMS